MPRSYPCTYRVGNKQCGRAGAGNPPLCEEHEEDLAEEEASAGEEMVDEFLDDVFDAPQVKGALNRVASVVDQFARLVDRVSTPKAPGDRRAAMKEAAGHARVAAGKVKSRMGHSETPPRARPAGPRVGPQPKRPAVSAKEDPRVVMGFPSTIKLTVEMVKERRKQLALIFHSDRGGSQESMKRLNVAFDALMEELKGKK